MRSYLVDLSVYWRIHGLCFMNDETLHAWFGSIWRQKQSCCFSNWKRKTCDQWCANRFGALIEYRLVQKVHGPVHLIEQLHFPSNRWFENHVCSCIVMTEGLVCAWPLFIDRPPQRISRSIRIRFHIIESSYIWFWASNNRRHKTTRQQIVTTLPLP